MCLVSFLTTLSDSLWEHVNCFTKIVREEIAPVVASLVRSQFLVFSLEISLGQHDQASALRFPVPHGSGGLCENTAQAWPVLGVLSRAVCCPFMAVKAREFPQAQNQKGPNDGPCISSFGSGWCKQKEVVFIYGATVSPTFTFWGVCVFPVALQIVVHLTEDLLSRASMTVVNGCPTLTINVSTAREHWLEGMLRHEIGGAALLHSSFVMSQSSFTEMLFYMGFSWLNLAKSNGVVRFHLN